MRPWALPRAIAMLAIVSPAIAVWPMACTAVPPEAPEGRRGRTAVVILADGLCLEHASAHGGPVLSLLLESSALGVANSRTASAAGGLEGELAAVATLASGRRIAASERAGLGFGVDEYVGGERAGDMYLRRVGADVGPPSRALVHIGIEELASANLSSQYRASPSLLGESLRRAGLATCAVGNSDDRSTHSRPAVLMAMDASGIVGSGDVSASTLKRDPTAPYGIVCDVAAMARAAAEGLGRGARIIAVDYGDLARLSRYAGLLSARAAEKHLSACYARLDELLACLYDLVGRPSADLAYVLLSPQSPRAVYGGVGRPGGLGGDLGDLAMVAVCGWGYENGVLTSATTRRDGLITNLDLTPTLLHGLGVDEAWPSDGAPMRVVPLDGRNALAYVSALDARLTETSQVRAAVLRFFIGVIVAAVVVAIAAVIAGRRPGWLPRLAYALLGLAAAQPLAAMLGPMVGARGVGGNIIWITAGSAAFAALAWLATRSAVSSMAVISAVTAAAILIDVASGARLASSSVIGYSAVIGARYYGVGNELMGVLVGSVLVGANRSFKASVAIGVSVASVIATAFFLGHPAFGANFGGMVSAAVAAAAVGLTWLRRLVVSPRRRHAAAICACLGVAVFAAAMAALDARSGSMSHIGRAWRTLSGGGGIASLGVMAARKLSMNLKLLRYTAWTRVLVAFLAALGVLATRSVGMLARFRRRVPPLYAAFIGGLAGAAAALAVNDSGVVACATTAMMPTLTLLAYAVGEREWM